MTDTPVQNQNVFADVLPATAEEAKASKTYHDFSETFDMDEEKLAKSMQVQEGDVAMLSFKDFMRMQNKVKLGNKFASTKAQRQQKKKKNRAAAKSRKNNR